MRILWLLSLYLCACSSPSPATSRAAEAVVHRLREQFPEQLTSTVDLARGRALCGKGRMALVRWRPRPLSVTSNCCNAQACVERGPRPVAVGKGEGGRSR